MDEGSPDYYSLRFVSDKAYSEFAEHDCEEFRALIAGLQSDPYPDRQGKFKVPGVPGLLFTYRDVDGFVYKLTYLIHKEDRYVTVTATSVQRLPIFGHERGAPDA